jgi:hypothetical protein
VPERAERWLARLAGDYVGSEWFDRIARVGYASKGVVFGIVGALAVGRGVGVVRQAEDTPGALEALRDVPLNEAILAALGIGLAGYALWRFFQALFDAEGDGSGWVGLAKRSIYLGIGGFYAYLAVFSVSVIFGARNDDNGVEDFTATVLGWPLGEVVVGLAGAGVILAGVNEIVFAVRGAYREEFRHGRMAAWERVLLAGAGWWGHVGRGAVYGLLGYLVIRAAVTFDPDEAAGLAEGFRRLEEQPFGGVLVAAAGVAFLSFGVYCAFIALHGEIGNEEAVHGSLEET